MSQCSDLLYAFERRGWKATLGELMDEGRYSFAGHLGARMAELKDRGYKIELTHRDHERPANNTYEVLNKIKERGLF